MRAYRTAALCSAMAVLAAAAVAHAGGPFVVDRINRSGVAQRWQGNTLEWCADPGDLSMLVDHETAVSWIKEAFNEWQKVGILNASSQEVKTTSIEIKQASDCPTDPITVQNIDQYTEPVPGPTMIVFDKGGDIIAEIMGEENRGGVVGLSQPLLSDESDLKIRKGIVILNGLMLEQTNPVLGNDHDTRVEHFKATVLHELGHLLNLDHSQTNYQFVRDCQLGSTCDTARFIPTMYPQLVSFMQSSLTRDDRVTVSWLYPTKAFEDEFCTITGEIMDGRGRPLKGVHVTATWVQGSTVYPGDARSFVSGAKYPLCHGDSRYHLHGIVPNRSYRVTYEAIGSEFRGASDFEPLPFPPTGFSPGVIESQGGDIDVICTGGGQVIQMARAVIDTANPCGDLVDEQPFTGPRSSSCSVAALSASGSAARTAASLMLIPALLLLGARPLTRRQRISE